MFVFRQELGWSVRGRWAGPMWPVDRIGGCQIVYGMTGSLHVDLPAPVGTPFCKNKEGKGSARAWPVAAPMPKSNSFSREK